MGEEENYRKALDIDEEIGDRLGQAQDLVFLGSVYVRRGEWERAEEYYGRGLKMFEEIGAKHLVNQTRDSLAKLKEMRDD